MKNNQDNKIISFLKENKILIFSLFILSFILISHLFPLNKTDNSQNIIISNEVIEKRAYNTQIFDNHDGSFTAEISQGDIFFFDGSQYIELEKMSNPLIVKKDIILNKKPFPFKNTFKMETYILHKGVIVSIENEELVLRDANNKIINVLTQPFSIDSNNNTIINNFKISQNDKILNVYIKVNDSWLKNAKYPVIIDPTASTTIVQVSDGYITYNSSNYTRSFGTKMFVGENCSLNCLQYRGFLEFNVASLNKPNIDIDRINLTLSSWQYLHTNTSDVNITIDYTRFNNSRINNTYYPITDVGNRALFNNISTGYNNLGSYVNNITGFIVNGTTISTYLGTNASDDLQYTRLNNFFLIGVNYSGSASTGNVNFIKFNRSTDTQGNPKLIVNYSYFHSINITFPINNTNFSSASQTINYTIETSDNFPDCSYTNSSGRFNRSITCGNNITATWLEGINNITTYLETTDGINSSSVTFRVDTTPPALTIVYPIDFQAFAETTVGINYTISDSGVGVQSCRWTNSSGAYNYSLTCGNNISVTETGSGNYNVTIYVNDTLNNLNSSIINYVISTEAPAVTINHPTNNKWFKNGTNINFNVTAIDTNGLRNASLWGNWTGTWHLNQTNISAITSGNLFAFMQNLTDGFYLFNFQVYNTLGTVGWGGINFTFGVDGVYPIVNITNIGTTTNSQTIRFNFTLTEINPSSCKYAIFNSSGSYDISNTTLSNCYVNNTQAIVSAYGTYNLTIYALDLAENENSSTKSFTTSQSGGNGNVGGGITIVTKDGGVFQSIFSTNFSAKTISGDDKMNIILAKNSVRPRQKTFYLINNLKDPINVNIACANVEVKNASKNKIDICNYVSYSKKEAILPPNVNQKVEIEFSLLTPPNSSNGDSYFFNTIVTRSDINESLIPYTKLSVKGEVSILATVFKWSYLPFQSSKPKIEKVSYPVIIPSIVLSLIIASIILIIFARKGLFVIGWFSALPSFLISFFIFLFLL